MKEKRTTSFYERAELLSLGFKSIGENVYISRKASIYGAEKMSIGSNVRIDDFCVLSGTMQIGNYIHIAAYTAVYGGSAGVVMEDFVGISSRVTSYAECDDFSGRTMTNPMIPKEYKQLKQEKVLIRKHVIIGATAVVLPGVEIAEGSSVGSFSFVNKNTEPWSISVGIPCQKIADRRRDLLELEKKMKAEMMGETN